MALRRNYSSLNRLDRGAPSQLKKGHKEKLVASLTNQQMMKAIKGYYPGDNAGFLEDMQLLRTQGQSIKSYYNSLKRKGYI